MTTKQSSLFSNNPLIPIEHAKDTVSKKSKQTNSTVASLDFEELGLDRVLISCLQRKMAIEKPTKIQSSLLSNYKGSGDSFRDILIQAQTGSGKTLSFVLPILNSLIKASQDCLSDYQPTRSSGVLALIILPTKELAFQIYEIIKKISEYKNQESKCYRNWIITALLTGGQNRNKEKASLRKGANIIVSTPGRILDHMSNTQSLSIDKLKYVVIDEGDRFYEMGFKETLTSIIKIIRETPKPNYTEQEKAFWESKYMPKDGCQFIICSATIDKNVKEIADYALNNPIYISAEDKDDDKPSAKTTPAQLNQYYVVTPLKLKLICLIAGLMKIHFISTSKKSMIFVNNTKSAEFLDLILKNIQLDKELVFKNTKIFILYGDMDVNSRKSVFSSFIKSESGILVCTDVCSRGLDIWNVTNIIQYDSPMNVKDYIHRIGRTARIGNKGNALLFLSPTEVEFVETIKSETKLPMNVKSVQSLMAILERFNKSIGKNGAETVATKLQNWMEEFVMNNEQNKSVARDAYISYTRAYSTYQASLKHIFHIKKIHLGHLAKSFALREAPNMFIKKRKDTDEARGDRKKRNTRNR